MSCLLKNTAARRYRNRFLMTMVAYVAALSITVFTVVLHHPKGVLLDVLAVLPAIPILGVIVVVGLYLAEETDEFQRTVLIHSMLWAMGLTLAVTTVWGFLEDFAPVVHFQPYLAFPLFWVFVGVSAPLVKLRYR